MSPHYIYLMKNITLVFACIIGLSVGCSKSGPSKEAQVQELIQAHVPTAPIRKPTASIRIRNLWTFQLGGNGRYFITEFENAGTSPIKAFSGRWAIYDDLDKQIVAREVRYTSDTPYVDAKTPKPVSHVIAPGERICITELTINGQPQQTAASSRENIHLILPSLITDEVINDGLIAKKTKFFPSRVVAP